MANELKEASAFLDLIKNILVCCCLLGMLATQCRSEQNSEKLASQIATLKNVCDEVQECVYHETVAAPTPREDGQVQIEE